MAAYAVRNPSIDTCTGPFGNIADARAYASALQATAIAVDPDNRHAGASEDDMRYYVVETTTYTRTTDGVVLVKTDNQIVGTYTVEAMASPS